MTQSGSDSNAGVMPNGPVPVGGKIGKYQIVEQLGSGGQSIVYKGYDPLLDRYVAIKQVAPHLAADERFAGRFRGVIRQLARLGCEQVVTVHELLEEPEGLFVVMEFVEGHTIASTLRTTPGPVEPKAVLQIIWRLAAGLAAIHKAGIIHRDIKPGNIIVGEGLRVKITDFGVAARAGVPTSMKLGTTKYMAPELFTGGEVDARADIYSLGMIAYEMLLGRAKFNEVFHEVVRDPHSEALRWMKWHSSADQTAAPLAEIDHTIPAALSAIVQRMLAKDPDERFTNVEALGREIRANFSPRGQRLSEQGPVRRRVTVGAAADAERRAAEAGMLGGDTGEAPALEPEVAEEPATAAIPTEPVSLRKKLTIAGCLAGAAVIALGVMLYQQSVRRSEQRERADAALATASRLYRAAMKIENVAERKAKFEEALAVYREVSGAFGRVKPTAGQALVEGKMCGAHIAMLEVLPGVRELSTMPVRPKGRVDEIKQAEEECREHFDRARGKHKELERSAGGLDKWLARMEGEFDEFESYFSEQRKHRQAVFRGLDLMRAGERAMEAGQQGTGADRLERADKVFAIEERRRGLHADQLDRIDELRNRIKVRLRLGEYNALISEGAKLAGAGNVLGAIAKYQAAIQVLAAGARDLSAADRAEYRKSAEMKILTLREETAFKVAMTLARRQGKNRLAAAAGYEKADRVGQRATKAGVKLTGYDPARLREKIVSLRHDHWLELGRQELNMARQEMAAGRGSKRLQTAEKHFKAAEKIKKSPQAAVGLREVAKLHDYRRLVQLGDGQRRRKNWAGALEQYNEARKLVRGTRGLGRELNQRITDCRFEMAVAEADGLRGQKLWDKASRKYLEARRIKPSEAARIDAVLDLLTQVKSYSELMAAAAREKEARNWSQAVNYAVRAKKILAKPEVDDFIKDVRYQQQLEQTKAAMARGDFKTALAYAKMAKTFKTTAELEAMIRELEEAVKTREEE